MTSRKGFVAIGMIVVVFFGFIGLYVSDFITSSRVEEARKTVFDRHSNFSSLYDLYSVPKGCNVSYRDKSWLYLLSYSNTPSDFYYSLEVRGDKKKSDAIRQKYFGEITSNTLATTFEEIKAMDKYILYVPLLSRQIAKSQIIYKIFCVKQEDEYLHKKIINFIKNGS